MEFSKGHHIKNTLLALIIFCSPFLIYIHLMFSKNTSVIKILGFEFVHTAQHNQAYVWFLLRALIPLILFILWYFTSTNWWKHLLIFFLFSFFRSISLELHDLFFNNYDLSLITLFLAFSIFVLVIYLADVLIFKPLRNYRMKYSLNELLKNDYKNFYLSVVIDLPNLNMQFKNTNRKLQNLYTKLIQIKEVLGFREDYYSNLNISPNFSNYRMTFVLVISFTLWFLNELVPDDIKELDLGIIRFTSLGFNNLNIAIWYICTKLMVLLPLSAWYIQSTYWWRYAILSPIILYIFQIWEVFQENDIIEAWGNIRAFPAVVFVLVLIIVVSQKVKYKFALVEMYNFLQQQIDSIFEGIDIKSDVVQLKYIRYNKLRSELQNSGFSAEKLEALAKLQAELATHVKS